MEFLKQITVVSASFLAVLAVVTALSILFTLYRLTRHRPRRLLWLNAAVSVFLTLVLVADGVNAHYSYLPNIEDVVDAVTSTPPPTAEQVLGHPTHADQRDGAVVRLPIPDNATGIGNSDSLVWLPRQYFATPAARFPVLYLFHGSPGNPKDWFRSGRAGRTAEDLARHGEPVIVVAPTMSTGWLDDSECVDGAREKVETHLVRDVIPAVDATFRTQADRTGRIFAGMSAGGFCALNLGLRNRQVAATILDFSGLTEPTHTGGMRALFGDSPQLPELVAANSPAVYAASLPADPPTRIWLDCGTDDHEVLRKMQQIAPVLQAAGMTVELQTRPGSHSYEVWRPALQDSLKWALSGSR